MKSKISIIVSVYNGEKSIERCISSICNQTYADIEVIIVNDGSTDRTREMCEQMCKQDGRIKLFNIQNGGVANARNYGIDHSTGDYIMFVDADDYIEKDMCAVLQQKMCQYNVKLVVSKAVDEDVCGNVIARPKVSKSGIIQFDEEFSFVEDYACFVSWGCLYKRDILDGIRFDSRFYVGEDSLFFYMVVNNCKKYFITDETFYHYVIYSNSLSNGKVDDRKYTEILAWEEIKKIVPKRGCNQYKSLCAAIERRARCMYRKSHNSNLSQENINNLYRIIIDNEKICPKCLTLKDKVERMLIRVLRGVYPSIISLVVEEKYKGN